MTIVVSGLSRCGTTMLMRCLDFGGVECVVDEDMMPSYETKLSRADNAVMLAQGRFGTRDHAIKVLSPWIQHLRPDPTARVVWCRRKWGEQAASIRKVTKEWHGLYSPETGRSVRRATKEHLKALSIVWKRDPVIVDFESMLSSPRATLTELVDELGLEGFDLEWAAEAVIPRTPRCLPGMLEDQLSREYDREREEYFARGGGA